MPDNTTTAFEPRKVNNTTLNAMVLSHPRHGSDGGRGPCPIAMALGTQLLYLWTPALRALVMVRGQEQEEVGRSSPVQSYLLLLASHTFVMQKAD